MNDAQVVLVVDDTPDNITLMSGLLKDHYKVRVALNGQKAIEMMQKKLPDIILLDIMMPIMDGYETCRIIKSNPDWMAIPIIFLTSKNEVEDESKGFELGASDYISKPVNPIILLSRIKTHLSLKAANDFLKDQNQYLEKEISRRAKEVALIQEVSIMAMASLAEIRDLETGYHLQRTKMYVAALCDQIITDGAYTADLSRENADLIIASAPLHDIGKIGIPDSILLKPGKFTKEEFEMMKLHTVLGKKAILKAERLLYQQESFLRYPIEIVFSHHEKWDGSGYPVGLRGEAIPISARIVAIADVYDALVSERVYKSAYSHEQAVEMIKLESGKHFDPKIVDAFLKVEEKFHEIAVTYRDLPQ
ncbi:two-component system response regulator [Fusibacter paucivorans]|uniref:Stage 0 sporulation protein A homolog n=1 Tax=Fusibacter paucivorans TaxID=76009 RepID=A0ABS5PSI7_9FIRM|nr:two-component system response regulator [Fusibacter paucivorans]MBS7527506.1 two-component system response regulator [Fusibacter paucivorans]